MLAHAIGCCLLEPQSQARDPCTRHLSRRIPSPGPCYPGNQRDRGEALSVELIQERESQCVQISCHSFFDSTPTA